MFSPLPPGCADPPHNRVVLLWLMLQTQLRSPDNPLAHTRRPPRLCGNPATQYLYGYCPKNGQLRNYIRLCGRQPALSAQVRASQRWDALFLGEAPLSICPEVAQRKGTWIDFSQLVPVSLTIGPGRGASHCQSDAPFSRPALPPPLVPQTVAPTNPFIGPGLVPHVSAGQAT